MSLTERVKEFVLDQGADFVGIAPLQRFEGAPYFSDPRNLLPGFRSVVAYGIAMNRGPLEAWFSKRNRRPLVLHDRLATAELNSIALKTSRLMEREGFKTTYVAQNLCYNTFRGRPDFGHKFAALAAGLGRLGLSSNFVHVKYGAAVHISSVITEAPLDPDPMVSDEQNPCSECGTCVQICPADSIDPNKNKCFVMEGKEYSYYFVDKIRCAWGCAGLCGHEYKIGTHPVGTWAYNDLEIPQGKSEFLREFLHADRHKRHPMELAEIELSEGTEYCGNCAKVCVGSKKENTAMLKLHIEAGLAKVPDDPTLWAYLEQANVRKREYVLVPPAEAAALISS